MLLDTGPGGEGPRAPTVTVFTFLSSCRSVSPEALPCELTDRYFFLFLLSDLEVIHYVFCVQWLLLNL